MPNRHCKFDGQMLGSLRNAEYHDCSIIKSWTTYADRWDNVLFVDCNLQGTDLSGLYLNHVTFRRCNLRGVNFRECAMDDCDFSMSDIRASEGLTDAFIRTGDRVLLKSELLEMFQRYRLDNDTGQTFEEQLASGRRSLACFIGGLCFAYRNPPESQWLVTAQVACMVGFGRIPDFSAEPHEIIAWVKALP